MAATTEAHEDRPVEVIESVNPATGQVIGTVPVHTAEDVDAAVARARDAFAAWSQLSHGERHEQLSRFRRALAERADEMAQLIHEENGKPHVDALLEVLTTLSHLAHAASRAPKALATQRVSAGLMANYRARIDYLPLGVIGVIGPWNYPLFTPMGSIAYALAAGNAVVFKPSELTPLVGELLTEIAAQSITIPDVLQVVTGAGATGAALAGASVDKLAFTGSTATGKKVMEAAARKLTPVLMELGGKDAFIVCEDADVDKAAEAAVFGALTNAGQACISVERCYVTEPVYERFMAKVKEEVARVTVGVDGHIGAITRPEQVAIIRDHIDDAVARGAELVHGGSSTIKGNFVGPTVLAGVTPEMKIMQEETFGPVLPIIRVPSSEDAVREANASPYGLGSAVFGKASARRIAERLRAGMTSINSVMAYAAIPALPFGGVGESGFGRIHGDDGLREFTRTKATAEERFALPLALLSFKLPDNIEDRLRMMIKQVYGGGVVDRAGAILRKLR